MFLLGAALVVVAASCSTTSPTPVPTAAAAPPTAEATSGTPSAVPATTEPNASATTATSAAIAQAAPDVPACAASGAPDAATIASWVGPVGGTAEIIPILVSAQPVVGPNRFLWAIASTANEPLAAPDTPSRVRFFALERDPETPYATGDGTFIDTGVGHGLYRTSVDFDCAGQWGAEVEAELPGGQVATQRLAFTVSPDGTTPSIGEPAPRSDSLTAPADQVGTVSTDPKPYAPAYAHTIAEVVSSGEPSMVFFATPAFCMTGVCGPTMEVVKSVAADYADRVAFVNVEPYRLTMTPNGLQPELDAQGNLQPVQAVLDYGIPVEPYLFVVDAQGDVFATLEGSIGADELRETLDEVLAGAATA